ncbi:MAG: NAD(P)H-hydrate dehydratase [Desulfobacterales bacterium]|nr:MAG: NAD(P)H-hydrate dehydratase [Desulfobacterales bacterium]
MYLVTAREMQTMDRLTIESYGIPGRVLMENAGRGATQFLMRTFSDQLAQGVGVIAGRGNNGGDGFVMARYLAQKEIAVTVYLLAEKMEVRGDADANLRLLAPLGIPVIEIPDSDSFLKRRSAMRQAGIWLDAIFGTGLKSDVKGYFKDVIDFINSLNKPVFAVDIPSGLNSDTGQPCGTCIRAEATATFGFAKTGHLIFPGAAYTGKLEIVDIGIPRHIVETVAPQQYLLTPDIIGNYIGPRPADAHKGRTGHVLVVAGSPGKTGAAAMTAMSAVRSGAGLVTLGIPRSLNPVLETQVLEAMTFPLPETHAGALGESAGDVIINLADGKNCLAIGPGLGQSPEIQNLMRRIITTAALPLVIDADGINNLAGQVRILREANAPVVLTPHPGEMARLMDTSVGAVQKDRIHSARSFAADFKVHLILKGARTLIAHPDGRIYINPTGNSGMASGGMGDVLTGIIAGLIAQGLPPESAAHAGVYLHGAAADRLAQTIGPFGFLASEVMHTIPGEIGKLLRFQDQSARSS